MDQDWILSKMYKSFNFLTLHGFRLVENKVGESGPLLIFEKNEIRLKFRYDVRERGFYLIKFKINPDDHEIMSSFYLSEFLKASKLEPKLIITPNNEKELILALEGWVSIVNNHLEEIES